MKLAVTALQAFKVNKMDVKLFGEELAAVIIKHTANGNETPEQLETVQKQVVGVISKLEGLQTQNIMIAVTGQDENNIHNHASTNLIL